MWYGNWVNWMMVILISPTFIVPMIMSIINRRVAKRWPSS